MLGGAVLLAALVFVLLALALRRRGAAAYRSVDRSVGAATAVRPAVWIVGLGLVMPAVVLAVLLGYALQIGRATLPAGEADVRIAAEASRYAWVFRYPGGQRSSGVLHLPAGRPVDLEVSATDVIHSLWIPRLGGKLDAIPGRRNVLRLIADAPGKTEGVCAEYCGAGHAGHGFAVVVHDAAGWAAFVATEGAAR